MYGYVLCELNYILQIVNVVVVAMMLCLIFCRMDLF